MKFKNNDDNYNITNFKLELYCFGSKLILQAISIANNNDNADSGKVLFKTTVPKLKY